jgi:hypothetical protein
MCLRPQYHLNPQFHSQGLVILAWLSPHLPDLPPQGRSPSSTPNSSAHSWQPSSSGAHRPTPQAADRAASTVTDAAAAVGADDAEGVEYKPVRTLLKQGRDSSGRFKRRHEGHGEVGSRLGPKRPRGPRKARSILEVAGVDNIQQRPGVLAEGMHGYMHALRIRPARIVPH